MMDSVPRSFKGRSIGCALLAACAFVLPGPLNSPPAMAQDSGGAQKEPDHTVILTNIEFKPNRLRVAKGETIRFINHDKFNHDVYLVRTANRNDVLHPASTIPPGGSVTVTIDQEGLFTLYCTIHGGMTGKITTTGTFELTKEEKERAASRKVIPPIVKVGEALYWGRAQCHRCHMIEDRGTGLRGPNHQDLGFRAAARAQKFGLASATEYIVQSIMEPSAHIVEGYSDDMPKVYQSPINLSENDIKALVAYLQSQGGEADEWSINLSKVRLADRLPPSPFAHGDPVRGEQVFLDTGCNACHTVGDRRSVSFAPELTAIGAYRNWTWLVQAITDPNAEIGANWKDATVYLKPGVPAPSIGVYNSDEDFDEDDVDEDDEGTGADADAAITSELADAREQLSSIQNRISRLENQQTTATGGSSPSAPQTIVPGVSAQTNGGADGQAPVAQDLPDESEYGVMVPGVLRKDSQEEVTLLVGFDQLVTFPRDQVAAVVLSGKSRMATNYGDLLSFSQLADLISYLETLKGSDADGGGAAAGAPGR